MAIETRGTAPLAQPLLAVRGLTLRYAQRNAVLVEHGGAMALQDISIDIWPGKTLALAGPSGSGKSSLARCLVLLERPCAGEIFYRGQNLLRLSREELRAARRGIHLIFQDSASALNPGLSIVEILAEPLLIHEPNVRRAEREKLVRDVMEQAELPQSWLSKRPLELSSGQRQRVAIGRALVLRPDVLILDEALASLDVSTQGQIANLLLDLQERASLAYLYITHDLGMVGVMAHEVALIRGGRIVRSGAAAKVLTSYVQTPERLLPAGSR